MATSTYQNLHIHHNKTSDVEDPHHTLVDEFVSVQEARLDVYQPADLLRIHHVLLRRRLDRRLPAVGGPR